MVLTENYSQVKNSVPKNVKLVAVSKTKPVEDIQELYTMGQRIFGENKVQELTTKYEALPKDIQWHFIGHLQRNKVKYIAPFVDLIHGVDSLKLLNEINKEGGKNNRAIRCLLQFHIAEEETKFGLDLTEAMELLQSEEFSAMKHVSVCGVMGMATYTDNAAQVQKEFKNLKLTFDKIKTAFFCDDEGFQEISMGMSGDYQIAIDEGSTMIRLGSVIFGERQYSH